tara:strand:- start:257 stop:493 length:237 start_codon:yes stop_codon:yes gene_type:complete
MQKLTEGQNQIAVKGETVRQVIDALEERYPGFKDRIVEKDRIKTEIAVAIDGEVVTAGLRARVRPDSEVHFLPALAGG